jgi:hypothetical protein
MACEGTVVNLGRAPLPAVEARPDQPVEAAPPTAPLQDSGGGEAVAAPVFGDVVLVAGVNSEFKDDNPTLTEDQLQLFFSSTRASNADVWFAERPSTAEVFSEPVRMATLSTDAFDSSPAVDADGLVLWVGTRSELGAGGVDIWRSRRATRAQPWPAPVLVPELNSAQDDIPRPTGYGGLVMPLGSRRGGDLYQTFLARRSSPDEVFGEPELVEELTRDGFSVADAFLTDDGLSLYYATASDGLGDLQVSRRARVDDPFGEPLALDSLNTEADERDPWLSLDGSTLYFASDREGILNLYVATRTD